MKLICDKCDKEIEEYKLYPEEVNSFPGYFFRIRVHCHGEIVRRVLNKTQAVAFNPDDYGDIHFFEKDEPKESCCEKWINRQHFCPECRKAFDKDITVDKPLWTVKDWNKKWMAHTEEIDRLKREVVEYRDRIRGLNIDFRALHELNKGVVAFLNTERVQLKKGLETLTEERDNWIKTAEGLREQRNSFNGLFNQAERRNAEIMALYQQPLPYTKAKPTEDNVGEWWSYRHYVGGEHHVVKIAGKKGALLALFRGIDKVVSEMVGEWAGPIPEPGETKNCGNCRYWDGAISWINEIKEIKCNRHLKEDTPLDTHGYYKAEDLCSEWEPI